MIRVRERHARFLSIAALLGAALILVTHLAVAAPAAPPIANNDNDLALLNTPLVVPAPGVLTNDTGIDGNSITAALATAPSNGTVTLAADGGFTYTPTINFIGTDIFTYTASDGSSSATASVTIRVLADTSQPVDIVLEAAGWNLFSYPLYGSKPITEALISVTGVYTRLFGYDASDSADPWKLYDRTLDPEFAPVLNDLTTLDYAHGYWIQVSEAATITFAYGRSTARQTLVARSSAATLPPATYFGYVTHQSGIAPAPDLPVTARIDGVECGSGSTFALNHGYIGYALHVAAADGNHPNCGQSGKQVTFEIDGQMVPFSADWRNSTVTAVNFGQPAVSSINLSAVGIATGSSIIFWLLLALASVTGGIWCQARRSCGGER